jgi:hypothetical protein
MIRPLMASLSAPRERKERERERERERKRSRVITLLYLTLFELLHRPAAASASAWN